MASTKDLVDVSDIAKVWEMQRSQYPKNLQKSSMTASTAFNTIQRTTDSIPELGQI